jgi:DNA polymerase-1
MILGQHGLPVEGKYFDTLIAAYLIDPSGQHKLDRLSELYLNYHMIPIEDLIGSGRNQKTMIEIPAGEVANYAAEDADMTMQLFEIFREKLDSAGMSDLFYKLEMPLLPVLMAMEKQGVLLDWPMLKTLSAEISIQISALEKQIYQQAGKVFNLNSPQQLGLILFDDLQIHRDLGGRKPSKTKTGQYSTSEPSLQKFEAHPLVAALLEYRKLTKLKNTYIDAFPELIHPKTGRVHTSYNQTVAATGRLSSSNPNLQNIPIRTEIGREMRRAFIPSEPGLVMVSADYSQIELRIMAHLSGDENMIRSFKNGQDIHASTAARVFNIGLDEVNSDQRRKAKEINFGIIYGMSRYGLAARLQISNEEAEAFIQGYFANYPGIKQYMNQCIQKAAALGYVETMLKRRRYLPEIRSTNRQIREFAERTAINTPIQGSAADMIKLAMIDIHGWIESEKVPARMILQVHDELVFEVSETVVAEISQKIKELMTRAMSLQVPLLVETGFGAHWLDAHE